MKKKLYINAVKSRAYLAKLKSNLGSDYVEMLVKILIAVVIGGLLLTSLTALFNLLLPEVSAKVFEFFGFGGSSSSVSST